MTAETRFLTDLAHLPTHGHGPQGITWWGTMGFVAIEGTVFVLAVAAYFYLMGHEQSWPPSQSPPDLMWGTIQLGAILASMIPNIWTQKVGLREDLKKVRIALVIMSVVGLIPLGIRIFEFYGLNCLWTDNAYGSIVWLILGLHTLHLLTDVGDTLVLTVLMFTRHAEPRRFTDVTDNCTYWNFVVLSWVPIWALIYVAPRVV